MRRPDLCVYDWKLVGINKNIEVWAEVPGSPITRLSVGERAPFREDARFYIFVQQRVDHPNNA